MAGTLRFTFPKGHPHEGKTAVIGGVEFTDGTAEVEQEDSKGITSILSFHSVAPEGSEEAAQLEEQYALVAAEKEKAAAKADKKKAAE